VTRALEQMISGISSRDIHEIRREVKDLVVKSFLHADNANQEVPIVLEGIKEWLGTDLSNEREDEVQFLIA